MSIDKAWIGILLFAAACGLDGKGTPASWSDSAHDLSDRIERVLATAHDPRVRYQALAELLDAATADDLSEVTYQFDAAAPYLYPQDLQLLASWWVAFDPAAALRDARSGATIDSELWRVQVLRAWAARDPVAARDAFDRGECGGSSERCLQALVAGWYAAGDEGVWSFVESLPIGFGHQRALDVLIASLVADRGVEEAIRVAQAIDPEKRTHFKLQVYRRIASEVAMRDAERAKQFAEQMRDGPFGDGLLRRVAVRWLARDGSAVMDWLVAQPPGPQRDDAIRAAARRWCQKDRAAALAWLRGDVDRAAVEPGLPAFALAISAEDPEAGLEIVGWIRDDSLRDTARLAVLRVWSARSPAAAQRWIGQAGLPDDVLAKVRNAPAARPNVARPR